MHKPEITGTATSSRNPCTATTGTTQAILSISDDWQSASTEQQTLSLKVHMENQRDYT